MYEEQITLIYHLQLLPLELNSFFRPATDGPRKYDSVINLLNMAWVLLETFNVQMSPLACMVLLNTSFLRLLASHEQQLNFNPI